VLFFRGSEQPRGLNARFRPDRIDQFTGSTVWRCDRARPSAGIRGGGRKDGAGHGDSEKICGCLDRRRSCCYRASEWSQSARRFEACLKIRSDDHPSQVFLNRIVHFREQPAPDKWNGVWGAREQVMTANGDMCAPEPTATASTDLLLRSICRHNHR
jgi:hypothetical protein